MDFHPAWHTLLTMSLYDLALQNYQREQVRLKKLMVELDFWYTQEYGPPFRSAQIVRICDEIKQTLKDSRFHEDCVDTYRRWPARPSRLTG